MEGIDGTVIWVGPSKFGSGIRVGLIDGSEETHWGPVEDVELIASSDTSGSKPTPERGKSSAPPAATGKKKAQAKKSKSSKRSADSASASKKPASSTAKVGGGRPKARKHSI